MEALVASQRPDVDTDRQKNLTQRHGGAKEDADTLASRGIADTEGEPGLERSFSLESLTLSDTRTGLARWTTRFFLAGCDLPLCVFRVSAVFCL